MDTRPEQYDEMLIGIYNKVRTAAAAKPGASDPDTLAVISSSLQIVAMFGKDVRRIANALEQLAPVPKSDDKSREYIGMPG